jgi:hypothetical protein
VLFFLLLLSRRVQLTQLKKYLEMRLKLFLNFLKIHLICKKYYINIFLMYLSDFKVMISIIKKLFHTLLNKKKYFKNTIHHINLKHAIKIENMVL